jgi:hypothetical protein
MMPSEYLRSALLMGDLVENVVNMPTWMLFKLAEKQRT